MHRAGVRTDCNRSQSSMPCILQQVGSFSSPPPPNDMEAASTLLLATARWVRQVAREADNNQDDPFESTPQGTPAASARNSPEGSPSFAGLPDITFPHIDPADIAAATSSPAVPPSVKSLLVALLSKDQDNLQALDDEAMSLLRDLANHLFHFLW